MKILTFKSLIYCSLIAALLNGSCSVNKPIASPVAGIPAESDSIPQDTAIVTGKLPNGFTYYIRRNVEPKNRAQLYLAIKVGSILENDDQQGLAHFMEHMSFNGTKNFPKNELVDYLQKSGIRFGADLNAYTSFDQTVYQLPVPTDDTLLLKNTMQIMRDWAQDASLDPVEIEKERGVVLEEKRLGKGAQERMQNKYLPLLFNNSRYSNRLPIGTEEVLKTFKPETLRQFYKDWYRPDLQALIVVGDIDVKQVEQTIISKFSDLKMPENLKDRTEYKIPLLNKNQFIAVTDAEMPYTVAQVLVKHPETVVKTKMDMRNSIIRSLYNQMMGARFSELSKQANPPFLQGGSSIGGFLAGLDVASAVVVAKPGEGEFEKGFKAVLTETERVKRFGFTQTELDRAKKSYLTAMEAAYKERDKTSSQTYVQEYLRLFLEGEASPGIAFEYKFSKDKVPGIGLEEVNALAKQYLKDTNRDVIIMAPEKEASKLPSEEMVSAWIQSVNQSEITAYVDQVSDKPLLAAKPAPGKITAEKNIAEIGVTELTLSNGVRVILKPTDFKNDEIRFNAYSAGGTSLYSDADYQSASNASSIISRSGVGEFNAIQLPKLLTGKRVSVGPYIGERSEGMSGFAAPADIETALQLTYLYFTQPRKDQDIYQAHISQARGALANREDDPNSVFSDTISAVLGRYNVRRTGPSISKIEQINLDRAYAIYKERFADASDFTFTFVGSFKTDEIKPLLEQYLGSLPSLSRKEQAKDLGIYPPSGKISKSVYKGKEDKASVRLLMNGDYVYNETNNNQLEALGEVLQIKLIERLREEESGVYSPRAMMSYSKEPRNRYTFVVSFGCAPENIDKLIAATMDEINKVKKNGPQPVDIEKFVAEQKRITETQLKDNSFWLDYLSGQYQSNEDPKAVLGYVDSLKALNKENIKQSANKYLSGNNFIKFILLPEQKK
ncbi:M16 family metallopeptidase [Desertivirga xinjiangensis]|uniref:M16 family metallopeptidase n=1 Tax=Desertivirga xinjiangensis TaxID=539206 RepID=UPI00210D50F3|nr:insulinase family protein [Pedobacter xinjiangensis]